MKKHYTRVLSLIGRCRTMNELKQVHGFMIKTSIDKNTIPVSKLIDFCTGLSGTQGLDYARSLFVLIRKPSVYTWNSMIRGYSYGDDSRHESLVMYRDMLQKGFSPDHFTFPFVLKACSVVHYLGYGRCVHSHISKTGFEANMYVSTCLLHMYATCGDMDSGLNVFDQISEPNIVAWTSLISGFVNINRIREAIGVFKDMRRLGATPSEMTMANVLVACGRSKNLGSGKQVHALVQKQGFDPFCRSEFEFNEILATTIMDMYAKCGCLRTARYVFDAMPQRSLVSWNCIISGYNQFGQGREALSLFSTMHDSGIKPDKSTFLSVIPACTLTTSLSLGQIIHAHVSKSGFISDTAIVTALVDMYAKAGDSESAKQIFSELHDKDVMAWTSIIIGLACHGHGEEALSTFRAMQEDGNIIPDEITYIGVLYACSHVGYLEEGQRHFLEMKTLYGIEPKVDHYVCMVDLLSRAGQFEEAKGLVQTMPIEPDLTVWSAMLNGCAIHENIDLVDRLRGRMMGMEEVGSGVYVLMSNIYARAGKWEEVELARELMKQRRVSKVHACSLLDL